MHFDAIDFTADETFGTALEANICVSIVTLNIELAIDHLKLAIKWNIYVLVIRGQLYLLGTFRVLVVQVDIGARLISEGYRCKTYIYNSTAVHKN